MIKRFAIALLLAVGLSSTLFAQSQQNVLHTDTTVFTSAARVASANSASQYSKVYRGVMLTLDVTAASGTTPTLDVKLQQFDALSGQWTDISGAVFQRITATGQRTLTVYPSPEGRGNLRSITGTNPAAGAEMSETVPANTRWNLLSFRAILATSAVVANRIPSLVVDDGSSTLIQSGAAIHTASATITYIWGGFGVKDTSTTQAAMLSLLPTPFFLGQGYRIRSSTGSIDVGDDYQAPQYLVEEFIGNYAAIPLPRVWRAVATIAGTTPSFTFTLAGSYIP